MGFVENINFTASCTLYFIYDGKSFKINDYRYVTELTLVHAPNTRALFMRLIEHGNRKKNEETHLRASSP